MSWTRTIVCRVCDDARVRAVGHSTEPCPVCGSTALPTENDYQKWICDQKDKIEAEPLNDRGEPLTMLDLTDDEMGLYRRWRHDYPYASKRRLLKWIEGRRYKPAEDAEFRTEADALLASDWHLGDESK